MGPWGTLRTDLHATGFLLDLDSGSSRICRMGTSSLGWPLLKQGPPSSPSVTGKRRPYMSTRFLLRKNKLWGHHWGPLGQMQVIRELKTDRKRVLRLRPKTKRKRNFSAVFGRKRKRNYVFSVKLLIIVAFQRPYHITVSRSHAEI